MSRMTVLIALLGLALLAGCNQSDDSGSEWVCAEGRTGNPNEQDWQCYSQQAWDNCSLRYVCEDAVEGEWFCPKTRGYESTCQGSYLCQDGADHYWACNSAAAQANCESNYFADPSDFFLCNSAGRRDPAEYWSCPDLGGNLPLVNTNFRQITVQTVVPGSDPEIIRTTTEDAPCNLDPVGEGCTVLGGEECLPLWTMTNRSNVNPTTKILPPGGEGYPQNYCNPVECTRM